MSNIAPIANFFANDIEAKEFEALLAKLEYDYSLLALGLPIEVDGKQAGNTIYWLHQFREALQKSA